MTRQTYLKEMIVYGHLALLSKKISFDNAQHLILFWGGLSKESHALSVQ